MNGADARAREDRVGRFRNHRHVDGDAIALLDVAVTQHVGEAADFVVQFAKGDLLRFFRIVAFPYDGDLVTARMQMPVDAIVGGVGDAILEPFDRDVVLGEGCILDLGKRFHPMNALGLLGPERVGILERGRVHVAVFGVVDEGALLPNRWNVINLFAHRAPPSRSAPKALITQAFCSAARIIGPLCAAGARCDKAAGFIRLSQEFNSASVAARAIMEHATRGPPCAA